MLNKKLRAKIQEVFKSQIAFAFEIKEQDSFVSKVVRGWRQLPAERQKKWAKALGCKPDEIFQEYK